jgi:hypothetical protein
MPHPTPMPAFAPLGKPELPFESEEVSDPAVLVGVLADVFDGSDEAEHEDGDVTEVDEEVELLDDVVVDEELEALVRADVDIVAPDEPRVRT